MEYSYDGKKWSSYSYGDILSLLNVGDRVYFRGDNASFSKSGSEYVHLLTGNLVAASGNVMSLLDKSLSSTTIPNESAFCRLFENNNITTPPDLPATVLTEGCYDNMFQGCLNLTTAPELHATNLAAWCYNMMFSGCTSLIKAPELSAMNLALGCYYGMFMNCSSLTKAPDLPAINLEGQCYNLMFWGCSSLNSIKVYFTDWGSTSNPAALWLQGVSSTGTFYCPSALSTSTRDESHIPSGWTISTF